MNLKKFRDIFKQGYTIVYKHEQTHWFKGWFGNRIVDKQRAEGFSEEDSQYSHAEICGGRILEYGKVVGYQSINVVPPKSKWIDITKTHSGRYIKVLKHKQLTDKIRHHIAYASARLNNLAYDKRGVLSFMFKWIRHDNRLYFCSEHVAEAHKVEIPDIFGKRPPNEIMPADFLESSEFVEVWSGRIE